jgi:small subunit ribosomal protein S7
METEIEQITEDEELDQMAEIEKPKNNLKLFGLYDVSEVKVEDPGLKRYINLEPKLVVKSYGRIREKFSRGKINVIELFANLIAVPGHRGKKHKIQTSWKTGKYSQNMKIVLECLKIIEQRTKQNPVQVLVKAIENAAPRDGVTVIEYGGARYPQAVDIAPLRRVNITLKNLVHSASDKSFNKKKSIAEAIAEEIILAFQNNGESALLRKKNESEKQADAAR